MKGLCLVLLLTLWPGGLCTDERDEKRRLRGTGRRIRILEHEPELLDLRDQTPLLQLGGLKLKQVVTINREKPWLLGTAHFSEEYHERRRLLEERRRLRENEGKPKEPEKGPEVRSGS